MGPPLPTRSSQKNPITAVFGDQRDYSVSKEKQSGPICCPSLAGVTSCNEVPYFSLPSLSPHLHFLLLVRISLHLPFLLVLFFGIFFFNYPSILSPSCILHWCCPTTGLWVAHMRRERLSFTLVPKTAQRPCGCW